MAQVAMSAQVAGPSRQYVQPLAYQLDLNCPTTVSHKAPSGSSWPFEICGPSTRPLEEPISFIHRRYLETLLLPEVSFGLQVLSQADQEGACTIDGVRGRSFSP